MKVGTSLDLVIQKQKTGGTKLEKYKKSNDKQIMGGPTPLQWRDVKRQKLPFATLLPGTQSFPSSLSFLISKEILCHHAVGAF